MTTAHNKKIKSALFQLAACAVIVLGNAAFAPTPEVTLEDIPGPTPTFTAPAPQPVVQETAPTNAEAYGESANTQTRMMPHFVATPPQSLTASAKQQAAETAKQVEAEATAVKAAAKAKIAARTATALPSAGSTTLVAPSTATATATPTVKPTSGEHVTVARTAAAPTNVVQAEATAATPDANAKAAGNKKMLMFNGLAALALIGLAFFNYFLWRSTRKLWGATDEQLADAKKALEEVTRVAQSTDEKIAAEQPVVEKAAKKTRATRGGNKEDAA